MKLEEYGVSKLTGRIILLVIGVIAAYIIFVVINQTRSSSTTHVDGRYIPAKTQAGSDICNEGIDVDLLCIEFLIYEGIDDDAKKLMSSGIEAIASRYTFTEPELTVNWAGFGSEGGLNNYVGVLAWHQYLSNRDDVISDLCQFIGVSKEYRDGCIDGVEGVVLNTSGWEKDLTGSYIMGDSSDNGHLILLNEYTFDIAKEFADIKANDPRITIGHEYFHLYQRVHTLNMLKASDNELPPEGPYWLTEGTAEYGAYKTASDEGWINWDYQVFEAVNNVKWATDMYPDMALTDSITFSDYKRSLINEDVDVILYDLGFLATLYAISLSSHDALMVDYYDDLEEYGTEKSFERNIGITLDDFHKDFSNLIQKDQLELLAIISPDLASDTTSIHKHFEVQNVTYTNKPSITNGVLSFTGEISDGYDMDEVWIFYDDLLRSDLESVSDRHLFCATTSLLTPECENATSELIGMVIPKPEKEYMHLIPELRYEYFFVISDVWETTGDTVVTVRADIQRSIAGQMYGTGIYTIIPMSGGIRGLMESPELIEKVGRLSPDATQKEYYEWVDSLTEWMNAVEWVYEPLDAYSVWVIID